MITNQHFKHQCINAIRKDSYKQLKKIQSVVLLILISCYLSFELNRI